MSPQKSRRLSWSNTKGFRKEYKLSADDSTKAFLRRKSIFSGKGSFDIGQESYSIDSLGGINRTIVLKKSSGDRMGVIDLTWYGVNNGELRFESGDRFTWKCIDFLRGQWAWFNVDGHEIMTFRPEDLMNNSGIIEATPEVIDGVVSDLLTVLGLHLKLFFNYWILTIALVLFMVIIKR